MGYYVKIFKNCGGRFFLKFNVITPFMGYCVKNLERSVELRLWFVSLLPVSYGCELFECVFAGFWLLFLSCLVGGFLCFLGSVFGLEGV